MIAILVALSLCAAAGYWWWTRRQSVRDNGARAPRPANPFCRSRDSSAQRCMRGRACTRGSKISVASGSRFAARRLQSNALRLQVRKALRPARRRPTLGSSGAQGIVVPKRRSEKTKRPSRRGLARRVSRGPRDGVFPSRRSDPHRDHRVDHQHDDRAAADPAPAVVREPPPHGDAEHRPRPDAR